MEYQPNNKAPLSNLALDNESSEGEVEGTFLSPPPFQLFASAATDGNGDESGKNLDRHLEIEIAKQLEGKIKGFNTSKILQLLFPETNLRIIEAWKSEQLNQKLPTFINLLKINHYRHYPREVAATFQALDPATRRQMISQILKKYEGKAIEVDEVEAAQVIFSMQGLANLALDEKQEAVLKRLLQDHSGITSSLKADVDADNEQLDDEKAEYDQQVAEQGSNQNIPTPEEAFRTTRTDLHLAVTQAENDLKAILKKWGNIGYTTNISPEKAIQAFEVLRSLGDDVRAEILRRYPDDLFSLNLNLPATYRGQLGFGIDENRGMSDKSPEFITTELAKTETWDPAPLAVNRLSLILGMAIQGALFSESAQSIESHLEQEVVWANHDILKKVLFLLTNGSKAAPSPRVLTAVRARINPENHSLLKSLGFTAEGWTAPAAITDGEDFTLLNAALGFNEQRRDARKRNKAELKEEKAIAKETARQNGEKFDRKAFRESSEITSGIPKTADFLTNKNKGIDLIDFSLVDFQDSLGGDVMGMEFSRDADPDKFPDAGKIDAKIGEGSATIRSESLPFNRLNYEMGSTLISCGEGFLSGVDAEFIWDEEKAQAEMSDPQTPKKVHTALMVNDVSVSDINYIGGDSIMAIGKFSIQNLKIDLNQGIDSAGEVSGGWGMNIIQTIASEIQNMIFLAMNSIMATIDPMMPDAGMDDSGSELSALLMASFQKSNRLDLSFGALLIENVMSQDSDIMRRMQLDGGQIQIGGSIVETYQAKAAAILAQASQNEEDQAKLNFYNDILASEKDKVVAQEQEIKQLEAQVAAGQAKESDLRSARGKGQLMLAASLNNVSLLAGYDENGAEQHIMAPEGQIDVVTSLNTPTLALNSKERDQAKIAEISGILNGENQLPESTLAGNQVYVEGENLLLPEDQAEMAGIDLNTILPGWMGGGLRINGETWTLELRKPELTLNEFPEIAGYDFCPVNAERMAWMGLSNILAKVEIKMNPIAEQKEKGFSPEHIFISEITADKLGGDNLEIRSDAFRAELREDSCLEGVYFRNIGIKMNEGPGEQEPLVMSAGAKKMSLNQVFVEAGAMLSTALQQFTAEDFAFSNFHQETIDPENANKRRDIDKMAIGFSNGAGENNSVTYDANPNGGQETTADFNLTSLSGEITTTSNKTKTEKDTWETQSSETQSRLQFELPGITVPSLNYGGPKDPFQIKGMDGGGSSPVVLNGIKAEVTVTQSFVKGRKDEDGNLLPESQVEKIWVNKLQIASLNGNDLRVVAGGSPFDLKGAATLLGLYASGFEMDMAGKGGMIMHGSAGFSEAQMEQLVIGMATVRDTATGAFRIARLATDDGYEYGLENLTGSAELDRKDADGNQVDALGADLVGNGMSASGKIMDSGIITARVPISEGINVYQLDWAAADGSYSIVLPGGQNAVLGPIFADIELKKSAEGAKSPFEYVKIKEFKIAYLQANGPQITYKNNQVVVPADKNIRIDNIVGTDLNYNLLTEEFSGKVTAEHIAGEAFTKLQNEMLKNFLSRPKIDLNNFSFEMEKNGDMEIGVGAGSVGLASGNADGEGNSEQMNGTLSTDEYQFQFDQLREAFPLIEFGNFVFGVTKFDPEMEGREGNTMVTATVSNPTLNGLVVNASALKNDESMPLVDRMELWGQIQGQLHIAITPKSTIVSTKPLSGSEEGSGSTLSVKSGNMLIRDFHNVLDALARPDKEKGEEKEKKQSGPASIDDYQYDDRFDFLDNLAPSGAGGGTIKISLMGGTAIIPVEEVFDPRDPQGIQRLSGYVDLESALKQIVPQAQKILSTYLDEKYPIAHGYGKVRSYGTLPMIERALIQNLDFEKKDDEYKIGFNVKVPARMSPLANLAQMGVFIPLFTLMAGGGELGVVQKDDRSLVALSHLLDYNLVKMSIPNPEKKEDGPQSPEAILAELQKYVGNQKFGIELQNFNIDIKQYENEQAANPAKQALPRPNPRIGEMFNSNEKGGGTLGTNLSIWMDPENGIGPTLELSNFKAPGFSMNKVHGLPNDILLSTSGARISQVRASVEDISKPETNLDMEGIELYDFRLELPKR